MESSPPWPDAVHIAIAVVGMAQVIDDICFVNSIGLGGYIVDFGLVATYYFDGYPPGLDDVTWVRTYTPFVDGMTCGNHVMQLDGVNVHNAMWPRENHVFMLSQDMKWIVMRLRKHK